MQLLDVNILIYSFREDSRDHELYRGWLEELMVSGESFAVPEIVLIAFLRLVTNGRIFRPGTPWKNAIAFVETIRSQSGCIHLKSGPRHWDIFVNLCGEAQATADLTSDAYIAALAIEHGCEVVTNDRDFARFPGLRWRHPLD